MHYHTKGEFHPTTVGNTFTDYNSEEPHAAEFHVTAPHVEEYHVAKLQVPSRTEGETPSTIPEVGIEISTSAPASAPAALPTHSHEASLHQTAESPKEKEEAYVPPVQMNLDREREREIQYQPTWDARRSVYPHNPS